MPGSHAGRLLDHVPLRVRDVEASKSFYSAALEPMGLGVTFEGDGWFSIDELFVSGEGEPTAGLSG
jgi:catechol 2,3-dioxygenase-like lactoylglutathione lyase family enzyme